MSEDRRDFPEWKVNAVYEAQDGCCYKCGATLEKGFHRHHRDGNPANNSIDNLELHCGECHKAEIRGGEGLAEHRKQEEIVLGKLNELIEKGLNKEISGAAMERLVDAMTLSLRASRQINGLNFTLESPPAVYTLAKRLADSKVIQDMYIRGLLEGIQIGMIRGRGEGSA
jgi:hypothetical protein